MSEILSSPYLLGIILIFVAVFIAIAYDHRGTPEERQYRQDIKQLKRARKEADRMEKLVDRLKQEVYD